MPYIQRNPDNSICGLFSIRQWPDQEYLEEDNAEVAAWNLAMATAAVIEALYNEADALAISCLDRNARERCLGWMMDPTVPAKHARIQACIAWMDTVWYDYAVAKAQVQAGNLSASLPPRDPPPYGFWDIVSA